jgi:hypothetical protein
MSRTPQAVRRPRLRAIPAALAALLVLIGVPATTLLTASPATADATHQAVIGMPFTGEWAYNTNVNPPYTDVNSSHPSVHHTPGSGDWATDIYAGESTAVKLVVPYATGALSFSWASSSTSCGTSTRVNIAVGGVNVGWLYFAHLQNAVTTGTITNGMTLGTVHNWGCNPGAHVHVEFRNTTNYSCYVAHGNPGVTLTQSTNFGVLGSTNVGARQACASVPSSGGTTHASTIGLYSPSSSTFYLRNSNTAGGADYTVQYGNAGWVPLSGDWDNNGTFTPGLYDPSTSMFYLRNSNSPGPADTQFQYGNVGWKPLAGDWNGNGYWSIGLYDPATGTFYLRDTNSAGGADYTFQFGNGGWKPIVGDWNNDHATTVGVYDPSTAVYHLNDQHDGSAAEHSFQYGNLGWTPIAGDWNGNGYWSIGAYDPSSSMFYLRDTNSAGPADVQVQYGNAGWTPLAGDWDGV